jgi:hypothetical protein
MHRFPFLSVLKKPAQIGTSRGNRAEKLFGVFLCFFWFFAAPPLQADDIHTIRNEANRTLRDLQSKGYVTPTLSDLSKYPARTIRELKTVLDGQSDDCLKAVSAALYLDAHRREASVEAAVADLQNTNLVKDLANIWGMAFLADINPKLEVNLQIDPYMFLNSNLADSVSSLSGLFDNLHQTLNAFVDHNREAIFNSQDVWVEDIIRVSTLHKWDENTLARAQEQMRAKVQKAYADIAAADTTAKEAVPRIEERFRDRLSMIESQRDVALYQLERERNTEAAHNIKHGNIMADFVAANQQARDQRVAEFQAALKSRQHMITLSLQRIARAHVQSEALARYALPIARGECDQISKTGPVNTPIACAKGDFMCELTRLSHAKLMAVFAELGETPSIGYLSCVCRAAGYGSSSTSQYYEPNTIGTYDERYSCQQPGPPCIVEGSGCMRYRLPVAQEVWTGCGRSAEAQGQPNPFKAVEALLRERAAKQLNQNTNRGE